MANTSLSSTTIRRAVPEGKRSRATGKKTTFPPKNVPNEAGFRSGRSQKTLDSVLLLPTLFSLAITHQVNLEVAVLEALPFLSAAEAEEEGSEERDVAEEMAMERVSERCRRICECIIDAGGPFKMA